MAFSWLQDTIGSVAGTLTTVAFVPQVVKTWRTRSARDISLAMYLAFCAGVALWMVYAFLIGSWPILIANSVTLVFAGIIVAIKIGGRGKK